jgi:hypothetical protein
LSQPNDLPVNRQARADLLNAPAVVGHEHDLRSLNHPVLGRATPDERFQSLARLPIEPNPKFRYPSLHPSFSCGFVEQQLDSAGERTGTSAYFHPSREGIVTFETRH